MNDNVEVAQKYFPADQLPRDDFFNATLFQQKLLPDYLQRQQDLMDLEKLSFADRLVFIPFAVAMTFEYVAAVQSGAFRRQWGDAKQGVTTVVRIAGQDQHLPDRIQTPSLLLSEQDIGLGVYVFEQALLALTRRYPDVPIGVVYIPAVISPYEVVSEKVHDYYGRKKHPESFLQDASRIRPNSERICASVREAALRSGAGFVDTRAALRKVAQHQAVHGPRDWNHFNRRGYEVLSDALLALLRQLDEQAEPDLCAWE